MNQVRRRKNRDKEPNKSKYLTISEGSLHQIHKFCLKDYYININKNFGCLPMTKKKQLISPTNDVIWTD